MIRIWLIVVLCLFLPSLAFLQIFAQEEDITEAMNKLAEALNNTSTQTQTGELNLAELGPWLAAIGPLMAASYAGVTKMKEIKVKGMEMSAVYEKEMGDGIRSIVETQRRYLYNRLRENPEAVDKYYQMGGKIPPELGKVAHNNAKRSFIDQYLMSSRLTKNARDRLLNSADLIIEQYVTENKTDLVGRVKTLLKDNAPHCIQSAMLGFDKGTIGEHETASILEEAWFDLVNILDYEQIFLHKDFATVYLRAELNRQLNA